MTHLSLVPSPQNTEPFLDLKERSKQTICYSPRGQREGSMRWCSTICVWNTSAGRGRKRGGAVVWTWNAFSLELFQVQREAVIPETGKVLQTIWQQMTPLAAAAECCFCCQENIHNKQRACVKSTHTPRCYRADVPGMHPCKWSAVVISKDKGGLITWLWPGADGWLRDHLSQPDGAATGSRKQKLWFKSYYWPLCVLLLICLM